MADSKISTLTALTGASADYDNDLVVVVDDSASATKKMTLREFGIALGLPAGVVVSFSGTSAPTGWLFCYGQAISRTTYSDLFTAISTTYGSGDGSTTFNVPDMRGRAAFGKDDMGGSAASLVTTAGSGVDGATLGATGGNELMQSHTHTVRTYNSGTLSGNTSIQGNGSANTSTQTSNSTGSGDAQNMPPAIILNYIIKI